MLLVTPSPPAPPVTYPVVDLSAAAIDVVLVEVPPTLPAPPPPPPDQFHSLLPYVPTPPLLPCDGVSAGVLPEPAALLQQLPPPEPPEPPTVGCPPNPPPATE